ERVAQELARVCRPGGTIAMANWNKEGFVGRMFQIFGRFIAPSGMPSPLLWGDESTVRQRFGEVVSDLRLTRAQCRFDYPFPPEGVVDFFRDHYGPAHRAFATLAETDCLALREALIDAWSGANQSPDPGRTVVRSEYLEVVATRANRRSR